MSSFSKTKKVTIFDILIIIFFIILIVISVKIQFFGKSEGTKKLYIFSDDEKYYYYMDKNKTITIKGKIGITVIEIKDGKFRFKESPCKNKICIHSGWISLENLSVACLPNKVSAYIFNEDNEDKYDGISR